MPPSVHVEVLTRAAAILGGTAHLRAHLSVPMRALEAWLRGSERPPAFAFLSAVDLISRQAPDAFEADALRRSLEARRRSDLIAAAAGTAREQAREAKRQSALALARSNATRAALLKVRLHAALNKAVNGTAASRGNVQLMTAQGLRIVAQVGFSRPFLDFFDAVGHGSSSACALALSRAQRIVVEDVRSHPVFSGTPALEVMREAAALACQSTPLLGHSGEVLGMLSTHYDRPHQPSPQELEVIDAIAANAASWMATLRAV
jgi:hypothetical protein